MIIMLGNLVTSGLGFGRGIHVTAKYFSGVQTDAWFAAYLVPQMFFDLIIGGAVAAARFPCSPAWLKRAAKTSGVL